jgi:Xaa-Pro dipeptidase
MATAAFRDPATLFVRTGLSEYNESLLSNNIAKRWSTVHSSLSIQNTEFRARLDELLEHLHRNALTGAVFFNSHYILYYSGFSFIPTERPIAFFLNSDGETALFVPRLELEHAQANAVANRVIHYAEYPHDPHPLQLLGESLLDYGFGDAYGFDSDGYPRVMGYRGPTVTQLVGGQASPLGDFIEGRMTIKSRAELNLIRESIKWGNLAHTLLQRYTRPGATETEVSARASTEATLAMLDAIGPIYRAQSPFSSGASAGYRGQIGRNAAIPHAMANNLRFRRGDVLVSGAGAPVWGYHSELERTMILGRPSDDQKRMFEHMINLQDLALNTMEPGVPCSAVDRAVRSYYEEHDLWPYWRHHTGHAIGLRYHEGPFLDMGDHTILTPGMVFTVEPGLYAPKLGGFRHSDTVCITEGGIEVMTYYPRDLDSLTLQD